MTTYRRIAGGGEGSPKSHFRVFFPLFLISFQVVFSLGFKAGIEISATWGGHTRVT